MRDAELAGGHGESGRATASVRAGVADAAAGGQPTIGLRCPAHPVAQALLAAFKGGRGGIAAPSANQFGHVSPTLAAHVRDEFPAGYGGPEILILEGGPAEVGIESTIVDLSRLDTVGPVLLRPGAIGPDAIAAVIGTAPAAPDAQAPKASGTLAAHYAPRTPLQLMPEARIAARIAADPGARIAVIASQSYPGAARSVIAPATPAAYAQSLYALLRELDAGGFDAIVVAQPPAGRDWDAVSDRLGRAAAAF